MKIKKLAPTPRRSWQELLAIAEGYTTSLVGVISRKATSEMIDKTEDFRRNHEVLYDFGIRDLKRGEVTPADVAAALCVDGWRERLLLFAPDPAVLLQDRLRANLRANEPAPSERAKLRDKIFSEARSSKDVGRSATSEEL